MVATALLDRLLQYATVIQIEWASYRLREHADLVLENVQPKSLITSDHCRSRDSQTSWTAAEKRRP